jgi:hypothetical protein
MVKCNPLIAGRIRESILVSGTIHWKTHRHASLNIALDRCNTWVNRGRNLEGRHSIGNGTHMGKLSLCIACDKARTAGRGRNATVQATPTNIQIQIQLKIASRWKQMSLDIHK